MDPKTFLVWLDDHNDAWRSWLTSDGGCAL